MDINTYWEQLPKEKRAELAAAVGRSVGYLRHVAKGRRKPSTDLAKLINKYQPKVTLAELRPDVWSETKKPSRKDK